MIFSCLSFENIIKNFLNKNCGSSRKLGPKNFGLKFRIVIT
jgi:hypothetical protein